MFQVNITDRGGVSATNDALGGAQELETKSFLCNLIDGLLKTPLLISKTKIAGGWKAPLVAMFLGYMQISANIVLSTTGEFSALSG
jgi:hypothetical protein